MFLRFFGFLELLALLHSFLIYVLVFSLFILSWILWLIKNIIQITITNEFTNLYNVRSSTKHTSFCMLLLRVCSSLMVVLFIISQLLCVLNVYLYIIIKKKKQPQASKFWGSFPSEFCSKHIQWGLQSQL